MQLILSEPPLKIFWKYLILAALFHLLTHPGYGAVDFERTSVKNLLEAGAHDNSRRRRKSVRRVRRRGVGRRSGVGGVLALLRRGGAFEGDK